MNRREKKEERSVPSQNLPRRLETGLEKGKF